MGMSSEETLMVSTEFKATDLTLGGDVAQMGMREEIVELQSMVIVASSGHYHSSLLLPELDGFDCCRMVM